jgi:phosphoribosylformimino-5-aminoimidazole carboxamide ribotide isomerase
MELYAAIDLRGGQAVRLIQGDFDAEERYGAPEILAERFVAEGAPWLHLVDLDAARTGEPAHREVILAVARSVPVPVQCGGGVRRPEDVVGLLEGGVTRVVLGTAALEDPGFARAMAERFPGRVALGLDYRRRPDGGLEARGHGWQVGSGRVVGDLLAELEGVALGAVIVTDIERDGTLSGPDLHGLAEVLDATTAAVIASGGVGGSEDLEALCALRSPVQGRALAGVVVGKALVDGRVSVGEAVKACAASA